MDFATDKKKTSFRLAQLYRVFRANTGIEIPILNNLLTKQSYDPKPAQAIIRETKEELGVTPTNIEYIDVFNALTPEGRGIKMYVFSGSVTEDIAPTNEIAELHWLTYDQMNNSKELLTPMTIDHVLPLLKDRIV